MWQGGVDDTTNQFDQRSRWGEFVNWHANKQFILGERKLCGELGNGNFAILFNIYIGNKFYEFRDVHNY